MASFSGKDAHFSDEEDEDITSSWLDDDDPEPEPSKPAVIPKEDERRIIVKSDYINANSDLFYALMEIDEWTEFANMSDSDQEMIMRTVTVRSYQPGENIIVEGDSGIEFYFVVASEKTFEEEQIEVVSGSIRAGNEVFLTRLRRGQYFGQKYFIARRQGTQRGATCRVPKDSPVPVSIGMISPVDFEKWDSFRNLLIVKSVPLLQKLPKEERQNILRDVKIKRFDDGDVIIREGDVGEEFFIIQEGSVQVIQNIPHKQGEPEGPKTKRLAAMREGDCFGEMALFYDQPRVCSIIADKFAVCLILSKRMFKSALSEGSFKAAMEEVNGKRADIRKQRDQNEADSRDASSSVSSPATPGQRRGSFYKSFYDKSRSSRRFSNLSGTSTITKLIPEEDGFNGYRQGKKIGEGQFGSVYIWTDKSTGVNYAMKQMEKPKTVGFGKSGAMNAIKQEIAVMKLLDHPNLELCDGGSLMPTAMSCEPLDMDLCRGYFRDILRGIAYMHSEGIVHRDIKPQNMLLSTDCSIMPVVKIADFGACVFMDGHGEKVPFQGTVHFMAPELFLSANLSDIDFTRDAKIDVFALGASLYFMLVGRPPWSGKSELELATQIKNIELTFPPSEKYEPSLKHLLKNMLYKDYETRYSLDDVIVDEWVTREKTEPLFDEDDYAAHVYEEDTDPATFDDVFKIMIISPSLCERKMLANKINAIKNSVFAGFSNKDTGPADAIETLKSAILHANTKHKLFHVIFVDGDADFIRQLRATGYTGKIVCLNNSLDGLADKFDLVDKVITARRPWAQSDLVDSLDLSDVDSRSSMVASRRTSLNSEVSAMTDSSDGGTPHHRSIQRLDSTVAADMTRTHSDEQDRIADYERTASMRSMRSQSGDAGQDGIFRTESVSVKMQQKGLIRRNKAFVIVPYQSSIPEDGSAKLDDSVVLDRPLKLFFFDKSEKMEKRRKKQEAMNISKMAHKFRESKKSGSTDDQELQKEKLLVTLMRTTSNRRVGSRKSFTFDDDLATMKHAVEEASSPSHRDEDVSLDQIDMFINNNVEDSADGADGERSSPTPEQTGGGSAAASRRAVVRHSTSSIRSLGSLGSEYSVSLSAKDVIATLNTESGDDVIAPNDSDDDDGSILESSEEGDFDFGTIDQHDDLDDIFGEVITAAPARDTMKDAKEWDFVMVLSDNTSLAAQVATPPGNYRADLGVVIGCHEEVGPRPYMEDRMFFNLTEESKGGRKRCPLAVFGVLDGHSGDYVVQMLQDKFSDLLCANLRAFESSFDCAMLHHADYKNYITEVFENTCATLDREILESDFERQSKTIKTGNLQTFAGSVGVVALVLPSLPRKLHRGSSIASNWSAASASSFQQQHHGHEADREVFVAHVGDCRAVLCTDGNAEQLTIDHKPSLHSETIRIQSAGGVVSNDRVHGSLGCSRSWGDIQFKGFNGKPKPPGGEMAEGGIWHNAQVFSKPDVMHFYVLPDVEFMILASDGLWDVFPNQQAVNFVRHELTISKNADVAARKLVQKAMDRGSHDNTSALICVFKPIASSS